MWNIMITVLTAWNLNSTKHLNISEAAGAHLSLNDLSACLRHQVMTCEIRFGILLVVSWYVLSRRLCTARCLVSCFMCIVTPLVLKFTQLCYLSGNATNIAVVHWYKCIRESSKLYKCSQGLFVILHKSQHFCMVIKTLATIIPPTNEIMD